MNSEIKRVLIETQSNKLFCGCEAEQDYDQRGGLCQVGDGHVILVTNPIDPAYLRYWKDLGFSLPEIIVAGPFNEKQTLSQHIVTKEQVRSKIYEAIGGSQARLEFFWIEESERNLADILQVYPYCNFDVSIKFSCKRVFKEICETVNLNTSPWVGANSTEELIARTRSFFSTGNSVLIKASNGTGGINLGSILKVSTYEDLIANLSHVNKMITPLVAEKVIDVVSEVSVHWEINDKGEVSIIDIFDQLTTNFSYTRTAYPSTVSIEIQKKIYDDLRERLIPFLLSHKARGYFCCDLLIDNQNVVYWTDFNPRKGAILYVYDMTKRLVDMHFTKSNNYYFWHEHIYTRKGLCFKDVRNELLDVLTPSSEKPFVVVTNPGIIRHGGFDVTGFSTVSREEAKDISQAVKNRFRY